MTFHNAEGEDADRLDRLARLTPDTVRAERVRAQCRTRLARRSQRETPRVLTHARSGALLMPIVVGGVCVLYALALLVTTLRFEGVF
jgi:hypothetical protein